MNYSALFSHCNTLVDGLKLMQPDLYDKCVPRRIPPPNGYANPRLYAAQMSAAYIAQGMSREERLRQLSPGTVTIEAVGLMLGRYDVPTYFIGEDFCRAVAATEPPLNTIIDEIKLPLPAMLFVMPLDFMHEYIGNGVCAFISFCRIKAVELMRDTSFANTDDDRLIFHTPMFYSSIPTDYTHCSAVTKEISNMCEFKEFVSFRDCLTANRTLEGLANPPSREQELQIAAKLNTLTIKLLMAMSAMPQMIEHTQECTRKVKAGSNKEALWKPNFIGRTYRIIRPEGYKPEGTHLSPRMHWRRGHFRKQHFGLGNAQTKVIWVQPVLVNGEEAA